MGENRMRTSNLLNPPAPSVPARGTFSACAGSAVPSGANDSTFCPQTQDDKRAAGKDFGERGMLMLHQ